VSKHAVERGSPEGAHLVEGDVHDLSFLTRVVDVIGVYSFLTLESLELIHFTAQGLACNERVRGLDLVDQDSVLVDLSNVVSLLQVVPRDFVVSRNVVTSAESADSKVNVRNARVHVYEDDVVVEYEGVEHKESYFGEEGDEESKHSRIACLLIVVVQFEEVSVLVLVSHVYNQDEEEVQTSGKPKPSDKFACQRREAVDVLLRQVAD